MMLSRVERERLLPDGLKTEGVELFASMVVVHARAITVASACPSCGQVSRRQHSRYHRRLADLPAHGREVRIVLAVRRFRCGIPHCGTRVFAERFPPWVTRPHGRGTSRLQGLVRHLGLALGGRPAQALASRLLLPVGKDTFLRGARTVPDDAAVDAPRVIGIDDRAWRRGQRYGTLICDLEKRRVVDLLPDREPATVEIWLRRHPQVEIVARDRNGRYAGAVTRALPHAVQVADRWHLPENAGAAFLAAVRNAMPDTRSAIGAQRLDPNVPTAAERLQYEGFLRRQHTNGMVQRMAGEGVPLKRIVRLTGLSRNLVRQIVRGEREDAFRVRQSSLELWLPRLDRERGGLLPERRGAVAASQDSRVRRKPAGRHRMDHTSPPGRGGASGVGRHLSARAQGIARMRTTARHHLSRADALTVARIESAVPALEPARSLAARFADMVRTGRAEQLPDWLTEAQSSLLASLARGLRADFDAVGAALREPWPNGQTEGQINRLKTLKRQMYGRAGIDLLRARLVAVT